MYLVLLTNFLVYLALFSKIKPRKIRTLQMQCTELEIKNLSILFIEYSPAKHISETLSSAYRSIFETQKGYPNILTTEELERINQLIKSCFELFKTLPQYDPTHEPEHDIIRMVLISLSHWFYEQYKTKRIKHKLEKEKYIWQIPKQDETELRKKFKRCFGAMPEQIIAVCCFYLLPTLIKSIKEKDLWTYGAILSAFSMAEFSIRHNADKIAGGKSIHTTEKKIEKAYKLLQKDYPNIKNKPLDEKILYCQEHYNLSEEEAQTVLMRIESN